MTGGAVLGLETSGGACSVALVAGGRVLARRYRAMSRGHAEVLVPLVCEAVAEAGVAFSDLGGIGVTVGPGSFTGIRVGLATARGLGLAADRPVVGITSFAAIAHAVPVSARAGYALLLVVIDTRRQDVFAEGYDPEGRVALAGAVWQPKDLVGLPGSGPILLAGDGAGLVAPALAKAGYSVETAATAPPDAVDVAVLAAARLAAAGAPETAPRALYLRAAEAVLPAAGGRLRA